jgi:hypothetical protein
MKNYKAFVSDIEPELSDDIYLSSFDDESEHADSYISVIQSVIDIVLIQLSVDADAVANDIKNPNTRKIRGLN